MYSSLKERTNSPFSFLFIVSDAVGVADVMAIFVQ